MSHSEINTQVINIIADKLAVAPEKVNMEANLATDLGADSLDIVELLLEFESVFEISIPEDEAEKRGPRGGRRQGAGRPPGRGRGSGESKGAGQRRQGKGRSCKPK